MATYSGVLRSRHKTLVAATQDTITFAGDWPEVLVYNDHASSPVYALIDSGATDVTVGGDDTLIIPPKASRVFRSSGAANTQVKLISAAAAGYSVEALTESRLNP